MSSDSEHADNRLPETPENDMNENPEDFRLPFMEEQPTYSAASIMASFDDAERVSNLKLNIDFLEDEESDLDESLLSNFELESVDEESDPEDQSDQKRRRTG